MGTSNKIPMRLFELQDLFGKNNIETFVRKKGCKENFRVFAKDTNFEKREGIFWERSGNDRGDS